MGKGLLKKTKNRTSTHVTCSKITQLWVRSSSTTGQIMKKIISMMLIQTTKLILLLFLGPWMRMKIMMIFHMMVKTMTMKSTKKKRRTNTKVHGGLRTTWSQIWKSITERGSIAIWLLWYCLFVFVAVVSNAARCARSINVVAVEEIFMRNFQKLIFNKFSNSSQPLW